MYVKLSELYKRWMTQSGHSGKCTLHGLHRGGATWAFEQGIASDAICKMGDWQSEAYLRYIDISLDTCIKTMTNLCAWMWIDMFSGLVLSGSSWNVTHRCKVTVMNHNVSLSTNNVRSSTPRGVIWYETSHVTGVAHQLVTWHTTNWMECFSWKDTLKG